MSTKKGLQGKKFRIIAPLQKLDKKEIVLIGKNMALISPKPQLL